MVFKNMIYDIQALDLTDSVYIYIAFVLHF